MARPSKHNWRNLYIEFCQGRYKSASEFAKAKGLAPRPVQREFKKLQSEDQNTTEKNDQKRPKQATKNDHNKVAADKESKKLHPWEALRKQFMDWPEEKVQAYLKQIEERLAELNAVPYEELPPEEKKELGSLRRERRAILSNPDPNTICKAVRNNKKCSNFAELGMEVCWNHGGAPGTGGQKGSKNALKTGEYEAIWLDALEEDEQELIDRVALDPVKQVDQTIQLYEFRERRMLQRIRGLMKGLTESQRRVLQERRTTKEPMRIYDEKSGTEKVVTMPRSELVVTEIEETEYRAIDDILRVEEALTRIQDKKIKAIELKHRLLLNGLGSEEHNLKLEKLKSDITISRERLDLDKGKANLGGQDDGLEVVIDYGDDDEG